MTDSKKKVERREKRIKTTPLSTTRKNKTELGISS